MERLLGILSTWVPRDRSRGLTLELGIKSSSDYRHYFNDFTMHDDYPFRSWDNLDQTGRMAMFHMRNSHLFRVEPRPWHDHPRNWAFGRLAGWNAAGRYLGSLLQFRGLKNRHLPRVETVNSLLIRHQFKRQMSPLALGKLVHESLVHITSFRLERWCRMSKRGEEIYLDSM
jgi:hypothetical protein